MKKEEVKKKLTNDVPINVCFCGEAYELTDEVAASRLWNYCDECREKMEEKWSSFLDELKVETLTDPTLSSLFSHCRVAHFEVINPIIIVRFPKEFEFYRETIREGSSKLFYIARKVFGEGAVIIPIFVRSTVCNVWKDKL